MNSITTQVRTLLWLLLFLLNKRVDAFLPVAIKSRSLPSPLSESSSFEETIEDLKANIAMRYHMFQKSQKEGSGFKQMLANVIAGEYDEESTRAKVNDLINSAPCVMFTWENSPSCKKAIKAMDSCGFEYTIVRMDDPWEEGNPLRAEIGKMVGRTSVPMMFIGGEYVGGFDGGVDDKAPGLVDLAFQGVLQSKLEAASAKKK
mmetsp:Transcript_27885/g.41156  ORF Transcript_27885/g.41156 Transcript_27885/m.41156 type:complete len:203 (-) Transcript_27885:186-794(-)|eukprot:CAMPEP_0194215620 /NCGR_PEP_ID=MMETSP0156-20130528/17566_1 /TAXON_ID=33649 /ORGANISM="Thalassionema nitzschioides, Strain L26-B" /LENGTH=202 /DNA_ID=CAMNT_0038944185 /DNA_START=88 /DNA_END=696 /DNA_ORIENTATION=-